MGINQSKNNNIYLITYNCQIKYFSNYKANRLLNYILNYKTADFILCIQGLYDKKTINYLKENIVEKINIVESKYDNGLFVFSSYDITSIECYLFNTTNKQYVNIIDLTKGYISFNIGLNNNLIAIYNTELQNDISNNLLFNDIRLKQISEILLFITEQKICEKKQKLHIIMGSLYLNDIKSNRLCDIINLLNKNIITNIDQNTKDDYILFFTEINYKTNDIIKYMHNNYGIELINAITRTEMNFAKNLPCEIILKIIKR